MERTRKRSRSIKRINKAETDLLEKDKGWTSQTGYCYYCGEILIADQPGGKNPRHKATGLSYGLCSERLTNMVNGTEDISKIMSGADICHDDQ